MVKGENDIKPIICLQPKIERKIELLNSWGFDVTQQTLIDIIRKPKATLSGHDNRKIALDLIDETHYLLVIYEETETILIITAYPKRVKEVTL